MLRVLSSLQSVQPSTKSLATDFLCVLCGSIPHILRILRALRSSSVLSVLNLGSRGRAQRMIPVPVLYYPRQFDSAAHQRRPRRIQQLISNHDHASILYRRNTLPSCITQSRLRLRAIPGSGPRQYNNVRLRPRHLLIIHSRAGLNYHSAARNLHQFRHPRRRTNPRIRPSLAVNPRPRASSETPRPSRRAIERPAHRSYQPLRNSLASDKPSKCQHIPLNIRQRPRIDRQKRDRLLEYFRHRFRCEGHRTDQQSRPQFHHFANIQFPAIAHRRPRAHGGHVLAPATHTDQLTAGPELEQNRSHTGRKRNDSHSVKNFARHDESNSTSARRNSRSAVTYPPANFAGTLQIARVIVRQAL